MSIERFNSKRRRGVASLALMAIGLPTIIILSAVILDETRVRNAYAQATEALLVAYRTSGKQYDLAISGWTSDYPPPANVICNFDYPAPDEPSNCEIGSTAKRAMGSGAAALYANVACGVAIDYLKDKSGLFNFVSQDGSNPERGVRAQFGIVSFAGEERRGSVLGSSTDSCERADIEAYTAETDGIKVTDVADSFAATAGEAAFSSPAPVAGDAVNKFAPKWFVGVIGIKVKRYLPFNQLPGAGDEYIYAKFIAPLQVVVGFKDS
jgi:hypothetical protein